MIIHIMIGILIATGFWLVYINAQKNELRFSWWQWALTIIGLVYAAFVLEVIAGFLSEGVPRGALVNGMLTGIPGLIYITLVYRFVLKSLKPTS